jgi:hypothetical protein
VGQFKAFKYLPINRLLFFAKAGKLSFKFSASGVLGFVGCSVLTLHSTLTTTQPVTTLFFIFLTNLLVLTLLWAVAG